MSCLSVLCIVFLLYERLRNFIPAYRRSVVQSGPSSHRQAGLWLATGSEGRNFQFARAVVHYDQPWQLARVEQRIGRLDRIGCTRYRKDVLSSVICAAATIEEALGLPRIGRLRSCPDAELEH